MNKQPIIIPRVQTTSLSPLECDFCSAIRQELMFFAVRGFKFIADRAVVEVKAGAFGACEACTPFVATRNVQGMIKRANPKTLVGLEYMAKLMPGLCQNFLKDPAPILTSIRLLPDNGRWVESDTSRQPADKNPYVNNN